MLEPTAARAAVGRWFRVLLPKNTIVGKIVGVSEDGMTIFTEYCQMSKIHLDTVAVWIENDSAAQRKSYHSRTKVAL